MNTKTKKSLLFAFTVCILTVMTFFSVSAKTVTKNKIVYEVGKKTATLVECKSNAKKIKIPSKVGKYKVTAIGEWAFSGKKRLQSVEIPKTVTKIGEAAFNECTSLKSIVIPSKVTRISSSAFWYCTNLEKAVIPASVTKFGKNIFEGCDKLTAYTVKGSKGEKYIKKQKHVKLGYRYMTSLKLDAQSVILEEEDTFKLKVTKKPKTLYNSKVSFSSNDEDVAKVSSKGVITAVSAGKAVITCKAKDGSGKKAVCTVTVKAKKAGYAVSPLPASPAAVTGLKITSVSDSSVSLSWNKVSDASGYKIYLYDSAENTCTYKWATKEPTAEIKGLAENSEYSFKVKAYKRNNYGSADSASYSELAFGKTLPGKVTEMRAEREDIFSDKLVLSWSAVSGAEGYSLYMYDKAEKDYVLCKSTDGLSAEVEGLKPGTDYYFRIKTLSGEREGSFSKTFTFTTEYLPLSSQQAAEDFIKALSATKNTDKTFTLETRFDVSGFKGVNEATQCVADYLASKERMTYEFDNGSALINGERVTVNDVIHPFGEECTLTHSDIEKDTVEFYKSGFGYNVSFGVSEEDAEKIVLLTDTEKLKKDIPGFVLYSFETKDAEVVNANVVDGEIRILQIKATVIMSFFLDGEKHNMEYTVSQKYITR
ncbi:MAG: leucine-rich repeat protein [Clostridia bacterium]|nr:leucine-rich repeat protein [Clostridia bacterium]